MSADRPKRNTSTPATYSLNKLVQAAFSTSRASVTSKKSKKIEIDEVDVDDDDDVDIRSDFSSDEPQEKVREVKNRKVKTGPKRYSDDPEIDEEVSSESSDNDSSSGGDIESETDKSGSIDNFLTPSLKPKKKLKKRKIKKKKVDVEDTDIIVDDFNTDYRIQYILGCKSLTQAEWRVICDSMESNEMSRGSVLKIEDEDYFSNSEELIKKYLIKWQHASFLHLTWELESDLQILVGSVYKSQISKFIVREYQGQNLFEDLRKDEMFPASFINVERVIAIEDDDVDINTMDYERSILPGSVRENSNTSSKNGGISPLLKTEVQNDPLKNTDSDNSETEEAEEDDDEEEASSENNQKPEVKSTNASSSKTKKRLRRSRPKLTHKKKRKVSSGSSSNMSSAGNTSSNAAQRSKGSSSVTYLHGSRCYLTIKWESLPYSQCTVENVEDLRNRGIEYENQLRAFYAREQRPHVPTNTVLKRNKIVDHDIIQSPLPPDFPAGQLRDYQWEGVRWMLFNWSQNRNSILADEMGLGKTIQTAIYIQLLKRTQKIRGPFLIIAPLSTLINWQRELELWTDLDVVVYYGTSEDRDMIRNYEFFYCDESSSGGYKIEVVVTTPETCLTVDNKVSNARELSKVPWSLIVVDEAHRLKNYSSKTATILREKYTALNRLLLTGTPLQNNVDELWALLNFVANEEFDDREAFSEQFGELKEVEQLNLLHARLRPYLLRRQKENVEKSVPPKEEIIIEIEMTVIQKQYYRAIYEQNMSFLMRNGKAPSLLNVTMELRKCCNHTFLIKGAESELLRHFEGEKYVDVLVKSSGKFVLLDKLLPRLKVDGHKVLIFSQFRIMLDILEDYFHERGFTHERVDGAITGRRRQAAIDRFSNPELDSFVMLLSTRAGGVGINLTAADTVIIYDSDWNPQNDIQAQSRAHRIGQKKAVKVYRLLTAKTYELQLFRIASLKLGLDYAVIHNMKNSNSNEKESIEDIKKEGKSGKKKKSSALELEDDPFDIKKSLAGNEINDALTKQEVERLLKHGAYDIFREEKEGLAEELSRKFCESDIDQILQRSSVIIHGGAKQDSANADSTDTTTGNANANSMSSFSKATFIAAGSENDISVNDPDFWSKVVGLSATGEEKKTELTKRRCRETFREGMYSEVSLSKKSMYRDDDDDDEDYAFEPDEEYIDSIDNIPNLSSAGGLKEKAAAATAAKKKAKQQSLKQEYENFSGSVSLHVNYSYTTQSKLTTALVNRSYCDWKGIRKEAQLMWTDNDIANACRMSIMQQFYLSCIIATTNSTRVFDPIFKLTDSLFIDPLAICDRMYNSFVCRLAFAAISNSLSVKRESTSESPSIVTTSSSSSANSASTDTTGNIPPTKESLSASHLTASTTPNNTTTTTTTTINPSTNKTIEISLLEEFYCVNPEISKNATNVTTARSSNTHCYLWEKGRKAMNILSPDLFRLSNSNYSQNVQIGVRVVQVFNLSNISIQLPEVLPQVIKSTKAKLANMEHLLTIFSAWHFSLQEALGDVKVALRWLSGFFTGYTGLEGAPVMCWLPLHDAIIVRVVSTEGSPDKAPKLLEFEESFRNACQEMDEPYQLPFPDRFQIQRRIKELSKALSGEVMPLKISPLVEAVLHTASERGLPMTNAEAIVVSIQREIAKCDPDNAETEKLRRRANLILSIQKFIEFCFPGKTVFEDYVVAGVTEAVLQLKQWLHAHRRGEKMEFRSGVLAGVGSSTLKTVMLKCDMQTQFRNILILFSEETIISRLTNPENPSLLLEKSPFYPAWWTLRHDLSLMWRRVYFGYSGWKDIIDDVSILPLINRPPEDWEETTATTSTSNTAATSGDFISSQFQREYHYEGRLIFLKRYIDENEVLKSKSAKKTPPLPLEATSPRPSNAIAIPSISTLNTSTTSSSSSSSSSATSGVNTKPNLTSLLASAGGASSLPQTRVIEKMKPTINTANTSNSINNISSRFIPTMVHNTPVVLNQMPPPPYYSHSQLTDTTSSTIQNNIINTTITSPLMQQLQAQEQLKMQQQSNMQQLQMNHKLQQQIHQRFQEQQKQQIIYNLQAMSDRAALQTQSDSTMPLQSYLPTSQTHENSTQLMRPLKSMPIMNYPVATQFPTAAAAAAALVGTGSVSGYSQPPPPPPSQGNPPPMTLPTTFIVPSFISTRNAVNLPRAALPYYGLPPQRQPNAVHATAPSASAAIANMPSSSMVVDLTENEDSPEENNNNTENTKSTTATATAISAPLSDTSSSTPSENNDKLNQMTYDNNTRASAVLPVDPVTADEATNKQSHGEQVESTVDSMAVGASSAAAVEAAAETPNKSSRSGRIIRPPKNKDFEEMY